MADNVSLGFVAEVAKSGISASETILRSQLEKAKQSTSAGIADLIDLQFTMSTYTVSANTFSAVMKEFSDTMKGVVQKMT